MRHSQKVLVDCLKRAFEICQLVMWLKMYFFVNKRDLDLGANYEGQTLQYLSSPPPASRQYVTQGRFSVASAHLQIIR